MKPKSEIKNGWCLQFKQSLAVRVDVLLLLPAVLVLALACSARAETPPVAIPFSDIGAKATVDYKGDALGITATSDGARLHCGFQKLEGHATSDGLWLESTEPGAAGKFRLVATTLRRDDNSTVHSQPAISLPATGTVSVEDKLVRFTRPGVTEEYSVSVDGVRQDFVIAAPPAGAGDLRLEVALGGARSEAMAGGAKLKLDGSGRELVYSRLRVEDAAGRELTARLEVLSADRLAVSVADANATYPVRIDPTFSDANWVSLNPGMPGANNAISAIVADSSGNVYVGGFFTFIGTVQANFIAKWDGNSWSTLGSGMNSAVNALAVSGTNLYAGGYFTTAGGVSATNIAKWDGSAWSALGSGMNGYVNALAVMGTNLYAGGAFTTAGGVAVNYIAKWDGNIWSALGSGVNDTGPPIAVNALAVSGTNLYAGGSFATADGVYVWCLAKWNGSAWSALGSGEHIHGRVYALAVSGTDLYVGGEFNLFAGTVSNIVKWDGNDWSALGSRTYGIKALAVIGTNVYAEGRKWDGNSWSALGSGMNNGVLAMAVSGTDLYAGGYFTIAGGVGANCIAKWNGSAWSALGSGMNNTVFAVAVIGTNLYAGGYFTTAGGVAANYIAKWDGSAWSALGSGIGWGYALAVSGKNLYAGGQTIAKWDGSSWSTLSGGGVNGFVHALAVSGNNLYAGGEFTSVNAVTAKYIAKWDGNTWSALGTGVSDDVYALAVSGTNLYAGGYFTTAGGATAKYIARWDGNTWSALGSGMNGSVKALAVSGTNLYAGGGFTTAGWVGATNIAKWNGSAWSALGSGMNGPVYALAVSGTDLYAGGEFTTAGGMPATNIAKWDGNAWSALSSGVTGGPSSGYSGVHALAADGVGHLFVGGGFTLAGNKVSPVIAQANLGSAPTVLTPPQSQTAEGGCVVNLAAGVTGDPPPTYQWFFNGQAIAGCISSFLCLSGVQATNVGTYSVIVSNIYGAVTSSPASLNVIPLVERRPVPGVKVAGETGSLLNVDYANSLSPSPNWTALGSVTLTSTSQFCPDVTMPLPSQRFYRAWQTGTPGVVPSLNLNFVPAIKLTGNVGDSLRLDCINAIGPTNAWVTLDTVTLTNTSQLYFDVNAPGQPQRLYRIMPNL